MQLVTDEQARQAQRYPELLKTYQRNYVKLTQAERLIEKQNKVIKNLIKNTHNKSIYYAETIKRAERRV